MPIDYSKNKRAQGFIKSAQSKGMPTRQEGDEIIAYPNKGAMAAYDKKTHDEIFHAAAGTHKTPSNLPTMPMQAKPPMTPPGQARKTLQVKAYRDNPDNSSTNLLSNGSTSTVTFKKKPGYLQPTEKSSTPTMVPFSPKGFKKVK